MLATPSFIGVIKLKYLYTVHKVDVSITKRYRTSLRRIRS